MEEQENPRRSEWQKLNEIHQQYIAELGIKINVRVDAQGKILFVAGAYTTYAEARLHQVISGLIKQLIEAEFYSLAQEQLNKITLAVPTFSSDDKLLLFLNDWRPYRTLRRIHENIYTEMLSAWQGPALDEVALSKLQKIIQPDKSILLEQVVDFMGSLMKKDVEKILLMLNEILKKFSLIELQEIVKIQLGLQLTELAHIHKQSLILDKQLKNGGKKSVRFALPVTEAENICRFSCFNYGGEHDGLRAVVKAYLPEDESRYIGKAAEAEENFFDAFLQCLNQRENSVPYTLKSLRVACKTFLECNSLPWLKEAVEKEKGNYEIYKVNIGYTAEEIEMLEKQDKITRPIIRGNPEIEGRLLCEIFKINLHIVRAYKGVNKKTPIPINFPPQIMAMVVTSEGIISSIDTIDYYDDKYFHFLQYANHFVPILKKKVEDQSEVQMKEGQFEESKRLGM